MTPQQCVYCTKQGCYFHHGMADSRGLDINHPITIPKFIEVFGCASCRLPIPVFEKLQHPAVHHLKTWPKYFQPIKAGKKPLEKRVWDRDYQVGDTLALEEWNPETGQYTGDELSVLVTYILDGEFAVPGECLMGINGVPFQREERRQILKELDDIIVSIECQPATTCDYVVISSLRSVKAILAKPLRNREGEQNG